MKILLLAISKNNSNYIDEGVAEFSKRIKRFTDFEIKLISPKDYTAKTPIPDIQKTEAELFLKALPAQSFLVLLDERGKQLTSIQFADFISSKMNQSVKNLVFGIGGSYGWDKSLKSKAGATLQLSALTFPHHLARLVTVEQIYRATTLINNQEYHH